MAPLVIARSAAFRRRWGLLRIAVEPPADVVVEVLLRPEHSRERLTEDERPVGVRAEARVAVVGVAASRAECLFPGSLGRARIGCKPEPQLDAGAWIQLAVVAHRCLGADQLRVDGCRTGDDVIA